MNNLFKQRLKRLSLKKKLVLIGSGLAFFSAFLPWYSDIDRFNVGATYLGISGPVYLSGFITLFAALTSASVIIKKLLGHKSFKLPVDENHLHIFNSFLAGLMLVLASSVFLHPDFGISIADKKLGLGMIFAFTGVGMMLFGSVLGRNEKVELVDTISIETPLFEVEEDFSEQVYPQENVQTAERKRTVTFEREPKKIEQITRDCTVEEAMQAHRSNFETNTNDIR